MLEIELNSKNLSEFIRNIRQEDKQELILALGENYAEKFMRMCLNLNSETYFLADDLLAPCAIGGVYVTDKTDKIGQVWLICAKNSKNNKTALFKYVKQKIELFKDRFNLLFNFIYKTNHNIIPWLKKLGFVFINTDLLDYKMFYYKKERV